MLTIPVTFAPHALDRIEERRISRFLVSVALTDPNRTYRKEGRTYYEKTLPDGLPLVVVTACNNGTIIVITTFIRGK